MTAIVIPTREQIDAVLATNAHAEAEVFRPDEWRLKPVEHLGAAERACGFPAVDLDGEAFAVVNPARVRAFLEPPPPLEVRWLPPTGDEFARLMRDCEDMAGAIIARSCPS